jgi:hypothetical protein
MRQLPSRWLAHSPMTEPAGLAAFGARLADEVAALNRVVQGLIIHCAWREHSGDDSGAFGTVSIRNHRCTQMNANKNSSVYVCVYPGCHLRLQRGGGARPAL